MQKGLGLLSIKNSGNFNYLTLKFKLYINFKTARDIKY